MIENRDSAVLSHVLQVSVAPHEPRAQERLMIAMAAWQNERVYEPEPSELSPHFRAQVWELARLVASPQSVCVR